jgi:uncharacterized protein YutE (UPF0331/DUF86 family)
MIDRGRILEKLAYLNEQVEAVGKLLAERADATGDPWVARGLRYAIQTAIEAMIDIAYHVSARGRAHVPQDAHDALDGAVSGASLPGDLVGRWHRMIGLRNRLVHGYQRVADAQLLDDVRRGLDDFRAFAALAVRWVEEAGDASNRPVDG